MKLPEKVQRYCPYCRKRTEHKINVAKQRARSATHPMSRWGQQRSRLRGLRSGTGNKGRFSKPPISKWKRKSKSTKRMTVLYTCSVCKKSKGIKKAIRTGRMEIGEKVAR